MRRGQRTFWPVNQEDRHISLYRTICRRCRAATFRACTWIIAIRRASWASWPVTTASTTCQGTAPSTSSGFSGSRHDSTGTGGLSWRSSASPLDCSAFCCSRSSTSSATSSGSALNNWYRLSLSPVQRLHHGDDTGCVFFLLQTGLIQS